MGHALLPPADGWQLNRRLAGPVEAAVELPAGDGEDGDATDCDGAAEPGTDGGADAAAPHAATISPDNVSPRNTSTQCLTSRTPRTRRRARLSRSRRATSHQARRQRSTARPTASSTSKPGCRRLRPTSLPADRNATRIDNCTFKRTVAFVKT